MRKPDNPNPVHNFCPKTSNRALTDAEFGRYKGAIPYVTLIRNDGQPQQEKESLHDASFDAKGHGGLAR